MKAAALLAVPVLFLFLFLFRLPVYLPAFLLNRRVFLTYDGSTSLHQVFRHLQRNRSIQLLHRGEALRLERKDFPTPESLAGRLEGLPRDEFPVLSRYLPAVVSSLSPWTRVRLILCVTPRVRDILALQQMQREHSLPIELVVDEPFYQPLFMACSYTSSPQENTVSFVLLFSSAVQSFDTIRVTRDGRLFQQLSPAQLAQGREYRTALETGRRIVLGFELEKEGSTVRRSFEIVPQLEDEPQLLLVSDRGSAVSFLETLYNLKKVPLARLLQENLLEYPMLVFDGISLKSFGAELTGILSEIYARKTASLFFISDSPGFGRRGDNPTIEAILPTQLSPRSLKYLPDLGILIMLDISGSMMGEKLSLAKVSTLELLKNLKKSDRISILTFWDQFRLLHGFEEKHNLRSEVQLAPLIAQGGTDLYTALEEGLRRLIGLKMPQKHVIILTDGKTKEGDFDGLIRKALYEDITISTLAVGEDINAELLSRLAQKTGGHFYRVLSLEEIPSIIFEDRKEIARSSFAEDLFPVFDFSGGEAGRVSAMNLFAPKPYAYALYRNQFQDPLLLLEKRDQQLVLMFLSDIYGHYTKDFFANRSVVMTFKTAFDSILSKNRVKLRVGEAYGGISFTSSGEGLVEPLLAVYAGNRLLEELRMAEGSFQTYSAGFSLPRRGEYTAILYSRGVPFVRFPFFFNGSLEGRDTESRFALQAYKPLPGRAIPASWLYLVLFFLSSVAVTFLSRRALFPRQEKMP